MKKGREWGIQGASLAGLGGAVALFHCVLAAVAIECSLRAGFVVEMKKARWLAGLFLSTDSSMTGSNN